MNFKVHESVVAQVIWPLAAASAKNAPATAPTPRHVRYDQPVLTAAGPCELAWCLSATRARRAAASTQAGPLYIASGCSPSVGQLAKAGQPADTCQPRGERQLRRAKPPAGQPTSQRRARPQDQPFWFTAGRHPQQRGTRPWPRRVLPALFLAGRGCGPSPGCGKPAWRRIGRALSKLAAGARVGRPRARRPARRQTHAAHSARGARGKLAACRGWWRARCSAAAARLAHSPPPSNAKKSRTLSIAGRGSAAIDSNPIVSTRSGSTFSSPRTPATTWLVQ